MGRTSFILFRVNLEVVAMKSATHSRTGWLFGFYGISTFVGYLMPNSFIQIISYISNNTVKHEYIFTNPSARVGYDKVNF